MFVSLRSNFIHVKYFLLNNDGKPLTALRGFVFPIYCCNFVTMTPIEHKVQTVRKYIYQRKGIDIGDINLQNGECLRKLEEAYRVAVQWLHTR